MNDSALDPTLARRSSSRAALAVFGAAFLVRLALLAWLRPVIAAGDEILYLKTVKALLSGLAVDGVAFPVWPCLLAGPVALGGAPAGRAFCAVLGALNVLLLFRLTGRLTDRRTAWVVGLLYAFYPEQALFSHLLYAEIALEFFVLSAASVFFDGWPTAPGPRAVALGFLLLGIGLLCRPLAVVPAAALAIAHWPRAWRERGRFVAIAALALLPALIYGGWTAHRSSAVGVTVRRVMPSPVPNASAAVTNLANLWTPNSYASERFNGGYYQAGRSRMAQQIVGVAHVLLVGLGILGLFGAPAGKFRTYGLASLALLSASCAFGLVVSRYRVPEMHVLAVFAGFALTRRRYIVASLADFGRFAACAALLIGFAFLAVVRWNTIGSWP